MNYSFKFYMGIIFIILSLLIGKITTLSFFFHLNDPLIRNLSIVIYILSWPLLIVGAIWVGREYANSIKKYASYRFYGQTIKKGTQHAIHKTKQIHNQVREQVKTKIERVKKNVTSRKNKKQQKKSNEGNIPITPKSEQ